MGLRSLQICYSLSMEVDFRRQILTSKVDPRTEKVGHYAALFCMSLVTELIRSFFSVIHYSTKTTPTDEEDSVDVIITSPDVDITSTEKGEMREEVTSEHISKSSAATKINITERTVREYETHVTLPDNDVNIPITTTSYWFVGTVWVKFLRNDQESVTKSRTVSEETTSEPATITKELDLGELQLNLQKLPQCLTKL